jgi:hypothetical protein
VIGGLSVREFALLARLGPEPLGQVLGASVIRTGWQYLPALAPGVNLVFYSGQALGASGAALSNRYGEASPRQVSAYQWRTEVVCRLDALTQAWNQARRQALGRLWDEAVALDADAVVGVRFQTGAHDFGLRTVDVVVTGTAIRLPGPRQQSAMAPLFTDLSVQDYWRLRTAGYDAVGLLADSVVTFASPPRATRWKRARAPAQNRELSELSSAFGLARETLRTNLHSQVYAARGDGAVGVSFEHAVAREKLPLASSLATADRRGWNRGRLGIPYYVSGRADAERRGWVVTMHATGTAIRRGGTAVAPIPVEPQIWMGGR